MASIQETRTVKKSTEMRYAIIRSRRKTIGLEITDEGLLVRAPMRASTKEIERVILQHQNWINKKTAEHARAKSAALEKGILTEEDIRLLTDRAKDYLPGRVSYYSKLLGVRPGRITIRTQKTRWGSCSAKGNLNFNCLLMITPPEVIDSVVVHELCHLLEMNHSDRFYAHVQSVFPDYRRYHSWLRKNGPEIMARYQRNG